MYAETAAKMISAFCQITFLDNPEGMESIMTEGTMFDAFDYKTYGSHKYIPADRLSADLGLEPGAGVYGYWLMRDDSYLLKTTKGRLALWSGKPDDKAVWPEHKTVG